MFARSFLPPAHLLPGLLAVLLFSAPRLLPAQEIDHTPFDMLCGMHVEIDGTVHYEGFRTAAFEHYVLAFASVSLDSLARDERLATVINFYNACVIRNVLEHAPLSSVMDIPAFFDEQRFRIAGRVYALREIERDLVLPLAPALAHFALASPSRSGPALRRQAYSAQDIRDQLRRNARRFMRDRTQNRLDREAGILYLSMIFRWFEEDFAAMYGSLRQCAMHFLEEEDARWLAANETEIRFLPWDWSLNDRLP